MTAEKEDKGCNTPLPECLVRLARIEEHQIFQVERQSEQNELQNALLKKIEQGLYGNGRAGAFVRLDRLEQKAAVRVWLMSAIAMSILGLITFACKNYFWPR